MNRSLLGYLQEILTALVADSRDALPEGILELLLAQVQTFKDVSEHSCRWSKSVWTQLSRVTILVLASGAFSVRARNRRSQRCG
jgi:hypothetical protein